MMSGYAIGMCRIRGTTSNIPSDGGVKITPGLFFGVLL
jgi:hypothetical protein